MFGLQSNLIKLGSWLNLIQLQKNFTTLDNAASRTKSTPADDDGDDNDDDNENDDYDDYDDDDNDDNCKTENDDDDDIHHNNENKQCENCKHCPLDPIVLFNCLRRQRQVMLLTTRVSNVELQ